MMLIRAGCLVGRRDSGVHEAAAVAVCGAPVRGGHGVAAVARGDPRQRPARRSRRAERRGTRNGTPRSRPPCRPRRTRRSSISDLTPGGRPPTTPTAAAPSRAPAREAPARCRAGEPRRQQAGRERVAGAGRVDHRVDRRPPGRVHRDAAGAGPDRPAGAQLHHHLRRRRGQRPRPGRRGCRRAVEQDPRLVQVGEAAGRRRGPRPGTPPRPAAAAAAEAASTLVVRPRSRAAARACRPGRRARPRRAACSRTGAGAGASGDRGEGTVHIGRYEQQVGAAVGQHGTPLPAWASTIDAAGRRRRRTVVRGRIRRRPRLSSASRSSPAGVPADHRRPASTGAPGQASQAAVFAADPPPVDA